MIDLQRFCAKDNDEREYLRAPWVADGWVYATNGHLCVRVPAKDRPDITQQADKHPKSASELFDKWFASDEPFAVFPPLPKRDKCRACDGRGWHHAEKCDHCEEGSFLRMGYRYDCQNCEDQGIERGWLSVDHDTGTKKPCEECYGRGEEKAPHKIGGCVFELAYLRWLSALPQARIRTHEQTEKDPAAILFDGGQAIVMPIKL